MNIIGIILLGIGLTCSVYHRYYRSLWRSKSSESPISRAITQLVGTAGAIYLSLELLFSFLKLPENWWSQSTFLVEPLALISLVLAILQPYGLQFWLWLKK